MRKSWLAVFAALLVCGGAASASNEKRMIYGSDKDTDEVKSSRKRTGKDVWIVSQGTDTGRSYSVCTAGDGFKFVVGDIIVMAAGADQVVVMNRRSKQYWQVPTKDFNGISVVDRFGAEKLTPVDLKKGENPDVSGQHVAIYSGQTSFDAERAKKMGIANARLRLSATDRLPITPAAKPILERLYGIKNLSGIPMRIDLETEKGDKIECLSTNWCLKQDLTNGFFEVPKRFKKITTLAEIENPKPLPPYKPRSDLGIRGRKSN